MLKKLLRAESEFSADYRQVFPRDDWGFTYIGGLEREALPTHPDGPTPPEVEIPASSAFPLTKAQVGDRLYISDLQGDRATVHDLQQRGVCCGAEIHVISRQSSGSVIISVGSIRLGLSASTAQQVMVSGA